MSNINLELSKSEAKELLDFFIHKRQTFMDEHADIFKKMNDYLETITKLHTYINGETPSDEYPVGGSWNQRIRYFLNQFPGGLSARQITKKIVEIENLTPEEEKQVYASVSPTLSSNTGSIYRRTSDVDGGYIYNLK